MDRVAFVLSAWQRLDLWDKWLFEKLNGQWTNGFFDQCFPFVRNAMIWAPLYLFLMIFVGTNFGKRGLWWIIMFLVTVAITDFSGGLIKDLVARVRPCQDQQFRTHVRFIVNYCPISYSFISNHAINHFAIAGFVWGTFNGFLKKWSLIIFAWAALICYAQVYVGVHYPLDVLGGAGIGTMAGLLSAWVFHRKWGTFNQDNQLI